MSKAKPSGRCAEKNCRQPAINGHYCRLHYIQHWKAVVEQKKQTAREKLNRYIESMSEKYPGDYLEMIKDDLGNERAFRQRLQELGFREELEGKDDNPFNAETVKDFLDGMKLGEE